MRPSVRTLAFLAVFGGAWTLSAVAWAWPAGALESFYEANRKYQDGKFSEAAKVYEKLAEQNPQTAAFYYNLGNSYYRLGSLGKAILAYERARIRDPRNRDIRKNLEFVRGLIEYKVDDKRNWYLKAAEACLEYVSETEISFLLVAAYFIFALAWVSALFLRPGSAWGWGRKFLLAVLLLFTAVYAGKKVETRVVRDAVVMTPQTEVRYGPSENDRIAFRLPEGLRVDVRSRRENWSRIVLANGESGWVRNEQIEEILQ